MRRVDTISVQSERRADAPAASSNVLIVDDEPALRRLLQRILERAGHVCTTAEDAAHARVALGAGSFDLMLCDVTMPGESGIDLAAHVTRTYPGTAVLMVTGLSSTQAAQQAIDAGAFGYLTKPFEPHDVLIQVAQALDRRDSKNNERTIRAELESTVADTTTELRHTVAILQETAERLRTSEEMFRTLADQSPLAILYSDREGNCLFSNGRASELSGRTPAQLAGTGWFDIVHPDDVERVAEQVILARESVCEVSFEHRLGTDGDREVWLHTRIAPMEVDGEATGFVAIVEDVTERRRHEADLEHLATHDALTGLANRTLVTDLLDATIQRCLPHQQVAVICLGLDRFSLVNETHGHQVGDELLAAVAKRLQGLVARADLVGRLGGDGFVVVREGISSEHEAAHLAEQISRAFRDPIALGGLHLYTAARMGIAISSGQSAAASMLRDADTAMHRAKETGAAFEYFSASMRQRVGERLRMEHDLRSGLDAGDLVVHYQPEVDAAGRVVGAEALVRWMHPELGMVNPADFIPLAEETGLIVPLGQQVLLESCRQALRWRTGPGRDPAFVMSVNISPRQFAEPGFVTSVTDALAVSGLPADGLCLEITESVALNSEFDAPRVLHELRDHGITLAIDDFGTGYSSLSYLGNLPVDLVKIDRSFIANMQESLAASRIVEAILLLSHVLGLRVVAEGIETREQHARLVELGCDLYQGYLFGRPVAALDFDAPEVDLTAVV